MKKTLAYTVVAVIALGSSPAFAAPGSENNAPSAADADSGTSCYVRGSATDPYQLDPSCSWHTVEKFDKDGHLAFWRYQDKGTLQPGNTSPTEGTQTEITQQNYGMTCYGIEVTTPDGQYSSNMVCKAS